MNHQELKENLRHLSTTHFCDASPQLRIFDPSLYSISKPQHFIGKALTVEAEGDLLPVMQAIELAVPGDVLVIASGGVKQALAGEIFTTAARNKGVAGIVLDGYCRDIDAIHSIAMPFYAKGFYPAAGTKQKLGQLNKSILCGGITIHPDDIIFGDDSGLIAMSKREFNELLPVANEIKAKEIKALEKLRQGAAWQSIFNLSEHTENLMQQRPSTLEWS